MNAITPTEPRRLRVDRRSNGALMTPEEFDAIWDWDRGYRYELIRGVLIVTPIPAEGERDINGELEYRLRLYRDTHPRGKSLDATLGEHTVRTINRRRPDRVVWAGLGRQPDPRADFPALVIEIVSRRRRDYRRDYEEKRDEYLAAGAQEYVIFNRFDLTATVIRKETAGVVEVVLAGSGAYRTPLLPGFELSLSELFRVGNAWPGEKPGRGRRTPPPTPTA
jgi:Uma2 family endonuclease